MPTIHQRVLARMVGALRFAHPTKLMLNNALNEVCNGVHIHENAFQTRLAFERSDLLALLAQINELQPLNSN